MQTDFNSKTCNRLVMVCVVVWMVAKTIYYFLYYYFILYTIFLCVTWKTNDYFVQNWFPTMLYSFLSNLSLLWDTQKKLSRQHQMFASRQTATIPFECHTQLCVWHLWTCSEYPLGKANGQRYALNVTFMVFWSHLRERGSQRPFLIKTHDINIQAPKKGQA